MIYFNIAFVIMGVLATIILGNVAIKAFKENEFREAVIATVSTSCMVVLTFVLIATLLAQIF